MQYITNKYPHKTHNLDTNKYIDNAATYVTWQHYDQCVSCFDLHVFQFINCDSEYTCCMSKLLSIHYSTNWGGGTQYCDWENMTIPFPTLHIILSQIP